MASIRTKLAFAGILSTACLAAQAAPVTYLGADDAVSNLGQMVNAQTARADFLAVAGALNSFGFEAPIPANLTVAGGTTTTLTPSCGALCGFNTTSGGSFFRQVRGGTVTFTFANPVDAFGVYVNGLQTSQVPQTIRYVDGSSAVTTIDFPSAINGGGAFVGFIDFGQLISSVTFDATIDFLGFDDLLFGRSASNPGNPSVPEPATLGLLGLGLAALGASRRRKRA